MLLGETVGQLGVELNQGQGFTHTKKLLKRRSLRLPEVVNLHG